MQYTCFLATATRLNRCQYWHRRMLSWTSSKAFSLTCCYVALQGIKWVSLSPLLDTASIQLLQYIWVLLICFISYTIPISFNSVTHLISFVIISFICSCLWRRKTALQVLLRPTLSYLTIPLLQICQQLCLSCLLSAYQTPTQSESRHQPIYLFLVCASLHLLSLPLQQNSHPSLYIVHLYIGHQSILALPQKESSPLIPGITFAFHQQTFPPPPSTWSTLASHHLK